MLIGFQSAKRSSHFAGFTLVETMISMTIVVMVMAGAIYSYLMANRMAEWSSLSLAAQTYAAQGAERARAAQWNSQLWPVTNGPGTGDELAPLGSSTPVFIEVDTNQIPATGGALPVTNYIYLTTASTNPPLRQIRSDAVWTFPLTQRVFTNTVVTLRAPDQ
jgi:type II secretory pathway pseudopilin PulG